MYPKNFLNLTSLLEKRVPDQRTESRELGAHPESTSQFPDGSRGHRLTRDVRNEGSLASEMSESSSTSVVTFLDCAHLTDWNLGVNGCAGIALDQSKPENSACLTVEAGHHDPEGMIQNPICSQSHCDLGVPRQGERADYSRHTSTIRGSSFNSARASRQVG